MGTVSQVSPPAFHPERIFCLQFQSDYSSVDDDEGSLQITVMRTLEMRPVIVNILNTAIIMDKPLILMHSALDVMYQQPENASIQDHWDQDEEELYTNNSATFATCVFVPDRSDYNSSLGLAFLMLRKMKDCEKEGGKLLSLAYEINGFGAFAIMLFDSGYQSVYQQVKDRAIEHPELYVEPCFHTPVDVTPDTTPVRTFFQDRILITDVFNRIW
ncbi:hypothetical protein EV421DRAFT_1913840 [Armillaria borealis]|uniref:Uncharacterized protein n=1 Tax=Armillaria borealis TaxID=47425 RepID=A0AA39ISW7_9AGAR|nr:hypothetical protein EV421DRAFT_1913840 [Armillaria borealis]